MFNEPRLFCLAVQMLTKDLNILGKYVSRHPVSTWFSDVFRPETHLVVVIPAYKEEDYLYTTLSHLLLCDQPAFNVGILVVFNSSDADSPSLEVSQRAFAHRIRTEIGGMLPNWIELKMIEAYGLQRKHFGAGWARKIGMDAVCSSFYKNQKPDGIVVTLDADTLVNANYFTAIGAWYENPVRSGANIYFEHPLEGNEFTSLIYNGITSYELHLRYLMQAHRYICFPFPFHAMGSAISMRAISYARAGGMPRKQAGEDFYFLQKLIPLGNFGEITDTVVYPSPRISDRVIFGTGAAISGHVSGASNVSTTYNFMAFEDLRLFFQRKSELFTMSASGYEKWTYEFSGPMRSYLLNSSFFNDLEVVKQDVGDEAGFERRFFEVFNAFRVVKYLNYVHEHFFEKPLVYDAAITLLEQMGHSTDTFFLEKDLLLFYRKLERDSPFYIGHAGIKNA